MGPFARIGTGRLLNRNVIVTVRPWGFKFCEKEGATSVRRMKKKKRETPLIFAITPISLLRGGRPAVEFFANLNARSLPRYGLTRISL